MPEGLIAVPIVAIVMGVFAVVIALGLNYRKRKEIFTLYHSERMLALEKGVPLPPLPEGLLTDSAVPYDNRRHLLKGMIWLFVGVGLGVALWASADHEPALFSLVPIGVGAAHLIYYVVEGRKPPSSPAVIAGPGRA